jgi:Rrf2 family protein
MKITTKGLYGTRAMLEIALNYGKNLTNLRDITEKQEIPLKYLEHLLSSLKAAGLIKSIRGARGGYVLAKSPNKIKLSEIISVLEGSMAPVDCVDNLKACPRSSICAIRDVWQKVKDAVMEVLDSITLQDLVKKQQEKMYSKAIMYYI